MRHPNEERILRSLFQASDDQIDALLRGELAPDLALDILDRAEANPALAARLDARAEALSDEAVETPPVHLARIDAFAARLLAGEDTLLPLMLDDSVPLARKESLVAHRFADERERDSVYRILFARDRLSIDVLEVVEKIVFAQRARVMWGIPATAAAASASTGIVPPGLTKLQGREGYVPAVGLEDFGVANYEAGLDEGGAVWLTVGDPAPHVEVREALWALFSEEGQYLEGGATAFEASEGRHVLRFQGWEPGRRLQVYLRPI